MKWRKIKNMKEQMSLENYKKKVEDYLLQSINKIESARLIELYEDELKNFYKEKLKTSIAGTRLLQGY